MRSIITLIFCTLLIVSASSQGVTPQGESRSTGSGFVNRNGSVQSLPALNKYGKTINPSLPVVTTTAWSTPTLTSITTGGNISSDGDMGITERGVCWGTTTNPTIAGNHTSDGSGTGAFSSALSGLTTGTLYYIRAYATNGVGTAYGNQITWQAGIGAAHQGGVIFYINGSGTSGLISATIDQGAAGWGCAGTDIAGTSVGVTAGFNNTNLIVTGCTSAGIAAKICYDLVLNGYSDWYLPSRDELSLMYQIKSIIGGFGFPYYWSSSQQYTNYAHGYIMSSGGYVTGHKTNGWGVRAIRSF